MGAGSPGGWRSRKAVRDRLALQGPRVPHPRHHMRVSLSSPSYLVRNPTLAPQLEETPALPRRSDGGDQGRGAKEEAAARRDRGLASPAAPTARGQQAGQRAAAGSRQAGQKQHSAWPGGSGQARARSQGPWTLPLQRQPPAWRHSSGVHPQGCPVSQGGGPVGW